MKIFDISRALSNELAPWPGDTSFSYGLNWKMAEGATVNVGAIEMSVHNGTHSDAFFHFDPNGAPIEKMPLDSYVGAATVIDLAKKFVDHDARDKDRKITIADLVPFQDSLTQAPRLLVKTGVWSDSRVFPNWIPVIAGDVPAWLRGRKVKLLGLDLPSVDPIEAKTLVNHHALADAGIAILESLDLDQVEGGIYNLSALPLKITGGDAGPVRAVLWRD